MSWKDKGRLLGWRRRLLRLLHGELIRRAARRADPAGPGVRKPCCPYWEEVIMKLVHVLSVSALAAVSLTVAVRAGGDKVAFPENYAKGVLYTTADRADIKQYRELYAPKEAIDAVKAGKPIPSGTVLTMVNYKAKLGADGNPEKDANGRFIKTDEIVNIVAMEKRTGWGAEYPADMRNGEWEYQAFKADRTVNDKANLKACFTCHKPLDKQDFVFSFDRMKTAK
jgi:hypothetical protein